MPDFYIRAEPIFSEESGEQYRKRICNIAAAELASEKRIWQRKKLEEIHKAQVGLNSILLHMNKYIPSCDAVMALAHYTELCMNKQKTLNNTVKQPTVMKNETITIEAPEGQVFDLENSTPTHLKLKKVESKKRPMSFLDIKNIKGAYISNLSEIFEIEGNNLERNRNVWPTYKLAEAALALSQLLQLRDAWNGMTQDDFVFDGTHRYFSICNRHDKVFCQEIENMRKPLSFKDEETRDAFLKQFRPLIETALPLL